MKRLFLLLLISAALVSICFADYSPQLNIRGYAPMVYGQVDVYRINNGINFNKRQPYLIPSFAPSYKKVFDEEQQKVIITTHINEIVIYPDVTVSFEEYLEQIKMKVYHQSLLTKFLAQTQQAQIPTTGLIKQITIELPAAAIPKPVQKVLGSKAGRLNLDGTQKITLTGISTKRKRIPIYETTQSSRFDVKMQQDTNLRLSGTIGDKISVNLKYNSNQDETFFDPNNINVKYTGYEDEVIQSVEAGNIALSLSGSRYISYSASSQGLFGITSKLRFGALDLTMIASKEEGQKNTQSYIGQSQADSTIIRSKDFAVRTFYFLERPEDLYDLYTQFDDPVSVPDGWVDNAIKTDPLGAWIIKNPNLLPNNGSVRVYIDDGNATNNVASIPGDTIFVSVNEYYIPYYDELIEGTDFITDYTSGTIQILKQVGRLYTVAVRYVRKDGVPVPLNSDVQDGILHAKLLRRRNQEYSPGETGTVWDYQMRNVYSMGITNIKNEGFNLNIYTENEDRTRNYLLPDNIDHPGLTTYNDYLRMDSNKDGLINGDDATVNLSAGYIIMPFIRPFYPLNDSLLYQLESENISYEDFKHYIAVRGKIGRDMISLGQTGILKGSVRVKVNGRVQRENIDYLVDYDLGQITFLTPAGKDPDAKIEIDYEFRSGFAVAKKTLAGVRADWNLSDKAKLGGTVIYRTEKVADKRPKIGNENIDLFMADIDGSVTLKPAFLTNWIDALPLIKTSAESRFNLSGEIAITMPNIYGDTEGKKNSAYLDDMEGIIDSYPLGVSFSSWVLGSKPWHTSLPKGRTNWYNPKNIRAEQVYDPSTLTEKEKKESITVLAMKIFPNTITQPGFHQWSYGGIMKYLGNQLDFSTKKYIELLVQVDKFETIPPNVILHIDLGDINEDFYTEYGGLNVLNSEDKNKDGVLTLDEDTGLDGKADGAPGDDPNDNANNNQDQFGDYPHINGTEGNRVLDTEDLDNNGVLNMLDRYFSYSVSLNDSLYLENENVNKWRLYRIPLNLPSAYEMVNNSTSTILPALKKISYVRIWAETDKTARIKIASASIVGNKWQDFHIRTADNIIVPPSELALNNESYISGIVDNQKNIAHYTSPEGTYSIEQGKETLEQALILKTENLQPGHQALLRQRFIESYNLLSYNNIRFWVYPEKGEGVYAIPDSVDIVFRLGADSLNYYQVRHKLPLLPYKTKMQRSDWVSLQYNMQDLTRLKTSSDITQNEVTEGDVTYSLKGRPTLTNIRELFLGVYNRDRNTNLLIPYSGIIYFNDMQVTNPFEDIGWANRLSLNTTMADFIALDIDYENKSENFNPTIQRGRTQTATYMTNTSLNITNRYFLNKFFPSQWGVDFPLNLNRTYSIGIPRYRANSDLLRSNIINPEEKEREKNESLTYGADIALSQRSPSKSPILAYTINKMSFSGNISQAERVTPTTRDTTFTWRGTYNYSFNLPENLLSLSLAPNYRFRFLPGAFNNSFSIANSEPKGYNWEKRNNIEDWYKRDQVLNTKVFNNDNRITWNLTSDISTNYGIASKRDLLQKKYYQSVNIGKETEFNQELGLNHSPTFFSRYFSLSNNANGRYMENQRKLSQTTGTTAPTVYQRDGSSTRTIRSNLTLMNSNILGSLANNLAQKASTKQTEQSQTPPSRKDKTDNGKPEDKETESFPQDKEEPKPDGKSTDNSDDKNDLKNDLPEETEETEQATSSPSGEMSDEEDEYEYEPQDTTQSVSPSIRKRYSYTPAKLVSWLARLKNIALTYQNTYSQVFTRKDYRPNFGFQIGLPHQVPVSFLDSRTNDNTYGLNSGYVLSRRIDTSASYSYTINQRYSNASNQSISITFPDVSVTISDLESIIRLQKYMTSARLNSGYQFILRQSGNIDWDRPKQETRTYNFNPLLSLNASILNTIQTALSYNISNSENITDMDTYKIIRKTNSNGMTGNLSYSFSSGKGIKLPFSQKRIHIRNELTSNLTIQYEQNYDTTRGRDNTQVDRNTSRFAISPGATYQFDQNIKGGLTSSYELSTDKKRDDGTRIFRLGIWVEINL